MPLQQLIVEREGCDDVCIAVDVPVDAAAGAWVQAVFAAAGIPAEGKEYTVVTPNGVVVSETTDADMVVLAAIERVELRPSDREVARMVLAAKGVRDSASAGLYDRIVAGDVDDARLVLRAELYTHDELYRMLATAVHSRCAAVAAFLLSENAVPAALLLADGDLMRAAVRLRTTDVLELLIATGVPVDPDGAPSPLIVAAGDSNPDTLRCLVAHGADVNAVDKLGASALLYACRGGLGIDCVKALIDAGAHVNGPKPPRPQTPLLAAARRAAGGCAAAVDACAYLLDCPGIDVNDGGLRDEVPLIAALEGGLAEIAMRMVRMGADVGRANRFGVTPVIAAAQSLRARVGAGDSLAPAVGGAVPRSGYGVPTSTATRMVGRALPPPTPSGMTVSHPPDTAPPSPPTAGRVSDSVREACGSSVNADTGGDGGSSSVALRSSAEADMADVCAALLKVGADPNAVDRTGVAPLLYAADRGCAAGCRVLLDHGADVNARDPEGVTPLALAARAGHHRVCELLLQRGAGPNTLPPTPLTLAVTGRHTAIRRLLLDYGAVCDDAILTDVDRARLAAWDGHMLAPMVGRGHTLFGNGRGGSGAFFMSRRGRGAGAGFR